MVKPGESCQVEGWAAKDDSGILSPFNFTRRNTRSHDATFKVTYCGVCHSDLYQIQNEWKNAQYPMLPGHEIVGTVLEVGSEVKNFAVGDRVGVGCMVWSSQQCDSCSIEQEQYCEKVAWTYNGIYLDGSPTFGGYSSLMVCDQRFVVKIPQSLPFDAAAPLLCAGITVYSPMQYFQMTEPGKSLGVVGLGGLGHMAVKFGKAFGLKVTVISTSPKKEKEAREYLGADHFLISKDEKQMQDAARSLDYIIDTVGTDHPLLPLISLLKVNGKLVLVGMPEKPLSLPPVALTSERLSLHKSRTLQTHGNKSAFHRLDIDSGPVEKKRVSPQFNGGDHRLHMVDAAENTRSPKVCIAAGLNAKMKIDCWLNRSSVECDHHHFDLKFLSRQCRPLKTW